MKLTNIFEEVSQQDKNEDYLICNLLIGESEPKRSNFKKYLATPAAKVDLPGQNYLDNMISDADKKHFFDENKRDLSEYDFSGALLKADVMTSLVLYGYDQLGKPPFDFSRTDEYHSFGFFTNCSTLTELPKWMPSRLYQFQLQGSGVKSLKNIHEVLKECYEIWIGKDDNVRNISYLAGIKGLDHITFDGYPELTKAVEEYLRETHHNDRDIIDFQSYLIDNDFEMWA